MRFGITILPEQRWERTAPLWREAEAMGFDHAWTYDHLVWGGLPDASWFGTTPTLTAAAMVTSHINLGTFVTSPNFRHPVPFMRDILAIDDISGGRFICGAGVGGDLDSRLLAGPELSTKQRVDRYEEFVLLLREVLRADHVTSTGTYFSATDARNKPGLVGDTPLILAANGPRTVRFAVANGDGWVTYGKKADDEDGWFANLAELSQRVTDAGARPGFQRHLNLDAFWYSLTSVDHFEHVVGRAAALGFTDVITHWPRADSPYEGSVSVLEQVAGEVLPWLRAGD